MALLSEKASGRGEVRYFVYKKLLPKRRGRGSLCGGGIHLKAEHLLGGGLDPPRLCATSWGGVADPPTPCATHWGGVGVSAHESNTREGGRPHISARFASAGRRRKQ